MNQKGLAPIFTAILLATVLVGGAFIYTNYSNNRTKITQPQLATQPSPSLSDVTHESTTSGATANWKTYRNDELGFELKYPVDWVFVPPKLPYNENNIKLFFGFRHPKSTNNHDISIIIRDFNKPIAELYGPWTVGKSRDIRIIDGEKIQVGGVEGYYFKDAQGPWPYDELYLPTKGVLLEFIAFHYSFDFSPDDPTFRDNFNQILSTFKFLPQFM